MRRAWFYILLSLASRERYGAEIQEDVRALSDGEVRLWPATLYGSLEELVDDGWIEELAPGEEPADAGGRSRWYRITAEGRAALVEQVERAETVAGIARRRLGREGT
ncbi:MAG: helix-turn-helix transcriptional regulator [Gemmatimonadota bacterium]